MKKLLLILGFPVLILSGLFLAGYHWDYRTEEKFCYLCGKTKTLEYKKNILNPGGIKSGELGTHYHFLTAYLNSRDEQYDCNHQWVVYQRFPLKNEPSSEAALQKRLSMIYWYRWQDINTWSQAQLLLAEMYQDSPQKTRKLIRHLWNPDNLISFSDIQGLFSSTMPWDDKWALWEDFKRHYKVEKASGLRRAVYISGEGKEKVIWKFDGSSYSHFPLNWETATSLPDL